MAGDAFTFTDIIGKTVADNLLIVLIMFIPFVLSLFLNKLDGFFIFGLPSRIIIGCISLFLYILLIFFLIQGYVFPESDHNQYTRDYAPNTTVEQFGLQLTLYADINQLIGSSDSNIVFTDTTELPKEPTSETTPLNLDSQTEIQEESIVEEPVYEPQILKIDFATLSETETNEDVKLLHQYFASAPTQMENEYTGMFEGKNLIFITAESFSHLAIDPEITPNLYRLYEEGFQFNNFYTPGWPVSTTDGEYVALNGLIPKSGVRSFTESADNYLPFTMGMQTLSEGYSPVLAYHNHSYTYYSRELSHPNMGYDYKGLGNGLEVTKVWPESDLEMMELTVDEYINSDTPFHAYYMTVSGHQLYTFTGNMMSSRNKEATDHLPYSEAIRAYLAANIELDKAIGHILTALEEAGKLEDTVIALSSDHYPYGLTLEQLEELNGSPVDDDFGKYQNAFLLWSGSMEKPVVVDKLAQSLDIIPTLSNIMGFSYDSRLLMGNDILGDDYEPLIIFQNRSFITNEGFYNARTGDFQPTNGEVENQEAYLESKKQIINNKFEISELILDTDYYSYVIER